MLQVKKIMVILFGGILYACDGDQNGIYYTFWQR